MPGKIDLDDVSRRWSTCPQKDLRIRTYLPNQWAGIWDDAVVSVNHGSADFTPKFDFQAWTKEIIGANGKEIARRVLNRLLEIRDNVYLRPGDMQDAWEKLLLPFINASASALHMELLGEPLPMQDQAAPTKGKPSWKEFPWVSADSGNEIFDSWSRHWQERLKRLMNIGGVEPLVNINEALFWGWAMQIVEWYEESEVLEILEMLERFRKEACVTPEMAELWNEVILPFLMASERALRIALKNRKKETA